MPIDSSIYNQGAQLDIGGSLERGMRLGDMIKKRRQMGEVQEAMKSGLTTNPDGSVAFDYKKPMSALLERGYTQEAFDLQDKQNAQQASALKQQTERSKQTSELLNNTLYNIENAKTPEEQQKAYAYGLNQGKTMGLDVSQLSPTFNPEVHGQLKNAAGYATDAKHKQDQQNNDRNYDIAKQRLDLDKDKNLNDKAKGASKVASDLRGERSGLQTTKDTNQIAVAYNKIQNSAKKDSPAGDMALIFAYMKMLDPGSTVREGEYATAQNATNIPGAILNAYNSAKEGTKLNLQQRQDFVNLAGGMYKAQKDQQDKIDSQYRDLANKGGVDPKDVILNSEANALERKIIKYQTNQKTGERRAIYSDGTFELVNSVAGGQ